MPVDNKPIASDNRGNRPTTDFSKSLLARILLMRYTDFEPLIRYNVVGALTYEKYTTVLCIAVSRRYRLRFGRHRPPRSTTLRDARRSKLPRSVCDRYGLHVAQRFPRRSR